MLTVGGEKNALGIADAAREYIELYQKLKPTPGKCSVPFRIMETGKVKYVHFVWLAEQWVFVQISPFE